MTEGERRFYLREIHSHWTMPRISKDRVVELHDGRVTRIGSAG